MRGLASRLLRWPWSAVKAAARWVVETFDGGDVGMLAGLSLLFYGVWLVDPPVAFMIVGALLVVFSYAPVVTGLVVTIRRARVPSSGSISAGVHLDDPIRVRVQQ